MRIIAGKYKNRPIVTPPGLVTRPLLSRIRKSLLDILQPHLEGARFLDLYSGTGILAMEALSRGAKEAVSIDADSEAVQIMKANHQHTCPHEKYRLIQGDVNAILPRLAMQKHPFDVIGITPPYGKNWVNTTLEVLEHCPQLMHSETVIFAQRGNQDDVKLDWPYLEHVRTKDYGRTIIEFFLPLEKQ